MRLQIVSDLHLEWHQDKGAGLLASIRNEDADALLLAGDVVSLAPARVDTAERQLRTLCDRFPRVYYVTGNHDFYGTTPSAALSRLTTIAAGIDNLVVLDTGRIEEHRGYRILGATMWFPFDPGNTRYDGRRSGPVLTDFQVIRDFVPWVYEQNTAFRAFLRAELRKEDIVVTHHLPSFDSVDPAFSGSDFNRFFVSDVKDLIRERQPALWVHGHTHHSMDYWIGPTHVVCNPHGYPGERTQGFDPALTVDLPVKQS